MKKPETDTEVLYFRLKPSEKKKIQAHAKKANLSVNLFLKKRTVVQDRA